MKNACGFKTFLLQTYSLNQLIINQYNQLLSLFVHQLSPSPVMPSGAFFQNSFYFNGI